MIRVGLDQNDQMTIAEGVGGKLQPGREVAPWPHFPRFLRGSHANASLAHQGGHPSGNRIAIRKPNHPIP